MREDMSSIDCFIRILPYLQSFYDDDISIAVTDREKFITCYSERSLCVCVEPGTPIPEGGASIDAIRTGKPVTKDVPEHIYGIPFRSYAVPIRDENGQIEGTVLIARSLSLSTHVKQLTNNAEKTATELYEIIQHVVEQMPNLLSLNEIIQEKANEIKDHSEDTKKILVNMQSISKQSNLLALNASIEAARAGISGRGFSVVAKHMEELSKSTDESIHMAENIINETLRPVEEINAKVHDSNEVFEQQAAALVKINSIVHGITKEMQDLVQILAQL